MILVLSENKYVVSCCLRIKLISMDSIFTMHLYSVLPSNSFLPFLVHYNTISLFFYLLLDCKIVWCHFVDQSKMILNYFEVHTCNKSNEIFTMFFLVRNQKFWLTWSSINMQFIDIIKVRIINDYYKTLHIVLYST